MITGVLQRPIWIYLMAHNELLSWLFLLFYWLVENGMQPVGSVYLPTWWLHILLESVYMRCISVFRNRAPLMRETERERAYKMKALTLACVFIWLRLLSMMDPGRPQAPGICIANRPHISHIFFPIYSLISPQSVFEWLCKGGGTCLRRAPCWGQCLSNTTFILAAAASTLRVGMCLRACLCV